MKLTLTRTALNATRSLMRQAKWCDTELCGFIVASVIPPLRATDITICDLWQYPSLRPQVDRYSLGRAQWKAAHVRANSQGLTVVGSFHTHVCDPAGPSDEDWRCARMLRGNDILRAVIYQNRIWFYDGQYIIAEYDLSQSLITTVYESVRRFVGWLHQPAVADQA